METYRKIGYPKVCDAKWEDGVGWVDFCEPRPIITYTTVLNDGEMPDFDYEARSSTLKGDHVHALPYSNSVGKAQLPLLSGSVTGAAYRPMGRTPTFGYPPESVYETQVVMEWSGNFSPYAEWRLPKLPIITDREKAFLIAAADTKALAAARKAEANLAMILRERRETLQMVSKRVVSLVKGAQRAQDEATRKWLKAVPKQKRKLGRDLSNLHLELVFGWLPLMEDIDNVVKMLSEDVVTHVKVRGTQALVDQSKLNELVQLSGFPGTGGASPAFMLHKRGGVTASRSVRTNLRFEITAKTLRGGVAIGYDPVGYVYDSVPLSFVTDFVSNFGQWLRCISPIIGMEFTTGSRTLRLAASEQGTVGVSVKPNANCPLVKQDTPIDDYSLSNISWDRTVLTVLPESVLQWQNNLDWFTLTASLSLLLQRKLKPLQRAIRAKPFRYRGPRKLYLPKIKYT